MTDLWHGLLGEGLWAVALLGLLAGAVGVALVYVCCGSRPRPIEPSGESQADLFEHAYAQWLRRHPTGCTDNPPKPEDYGVTEE